MKTLIICTSVHHHNTEKVARAIAGVLDAEMVTPAGISPDIPGEYDLIGFGSGIYFSRHHRAIERFVASLPPQHGRYAFVFSTSGMGWRRYNRGLVRMLEEKGFEVLGDFTCKGWDTYAIFGLIGGINKGRPNEQDLAKARAFAKGLREKMRQVSHNRGK